MSYLLYFIFDSVFDLFFFEQVVTPILFTSIGS